MHENLKDNKVHLISNDSYFEMVRAMLDEGKEVRIRVKGDSMLPFIEDGDSVLLRSYKGNTLPIGSSVLAKHQNRFVFHRYVGKKNTQMILAGDGNLVLREYIANTDIIAVACMHYPQNSSSINDLNGRYPRLRGLVWYHIRLLRRIIAKLLGSTSR